MHTAQIMKHSMPAMQEKGNARRTSLWRFRGRAKRDFVTRCIKLK